MSRCRHAQPAPPSRPALRLPELLALLREEPFRLFFPWGLLVGCLGAGLWPAFQAGWYPHPPGQPWDLHGRLMILGLGGALVIGFLATAAPRMLGTPALNRLEVLLLGAGHAASVIALLTAHSRAGCLLFALTLAALIAMLARRGRRRTDLPPPGFVLVLLGLLCGLGGALLHAGGWDLGGLPYGYRLARVLMNEGFLLLPVLGVGGFLMPRILGLPGRQVFPDARTPPPGWWPLFVEALAAGLLILFSLLLEAAWSLRGGVALRLVVVLLWWRRDLPGLWRVRVNGTQAWAARLGLAMLALSCLARLLDPARLIALEHLLFIGGFGITMLAVAARVVDGHSGHRAAAKGVSKPLRWIVWLAFLAMATRITADYVPAIQRSHYAYAAVTWIALSLLWLWHHRRRLVTPE